MWKMLQQKRPADFVIATGQSHTVREFVEVVAKAMNMRIKWQGKGEKEVGVDDSGKVIVRVNKRYYRPREVNNLRGNSGKARKILHWRPKVSFDGLARMMAVEDLKTVARENGLQYKLN